MKTPEEKKLQEQGEKICCLMNLCNSRLEEIRGLNTDLREAVLWWRVWRFAALLSAAGAAYMIGVMK